MSEPREPLKEGGLKRQPQKPAGGEGLTHTGGGERRGDGVDEDEAGGMIGEGDTPPDDDL